MNFNKFVKYYLLGESVKEIELNRILDKVSKKRSLNSREKNFLDLYQSTSEEDMKDLMYLSKNTAFNKIKDLIGRGKKVICDLHDRNGKFGLQIIDVENDFVDETCIIKMKGDETYKLYDKFLYNIIYDNNKDIYSLQEQDEYFEPILIKNED